MKPDDKTQAFPQRRSLPHDIPAWVTQGARHYITINAEDRTGSPFITPQIAHALFDALLFYDTTQRWVLWSAVIMPDHLHFIATFNLTDGLKKPITQLKRYLSREFKIQFQQGFFEHRIRNENEFAEKIAYIRMNPVREKLVANPDDWPYLWMRKTHT